MVVVQTAWPDGHEGPNLATSAQAVPKVPQGSSFELDLAVGSPLGTACPFPVHVSGTSAQKTDDTNGVVVATGPFVATFTNLDNARPSPTAFGADAGRPGLRRHGVRRRHQLVGVWSLEVSVDAVVSSVHGMVHPEKPSHLGAASHYPHADRLASALTGGRVSRRSPVNLPGAPGCWSQSVAGPAAAPARVILWVPVWSDR
jgi:hypothetical protein